MNEVDYQKWLPLIMFECMPEAGQKFFFFMEKKFEAQLSVTYHGVAIAPVCKIYVQNPDEYQYFSDLILNICNQIGVECEIKGYDG